MRPRTIILLFLVPLALLIALSFLLKFVQSQVPTTGQQLRAAADSRLPLRQNAIPLVDYIPSSPPPALASVNLPDLATGPGLDPELHTSIAPPNAWYLHSKNLSGNWSSPPFGPTKPDYARLIVRVLEKDGYFEPEKLLTQAVARANAYPAHTQFKKWLTADTALLERATTTENALELLFVLSQTPPLGPVLTFSRDNLTWYAWAKPDEFTKKKSLYRLVAFASDGSQAYDARWSFTQSPPEPDAALAPAQAWLIAGLIHQSHLAGKPSATLPID